MFEIGVVFKEGLAALDLRFPDEADVPQLREDKRSGAVDFIDDPLPSGESVFPVNPGRVAFVAGARVRDEGPLGDDEADAALCAAAVVAGNVRARHAVG